MKVRHSVELTIPDGDIATVQSAVATMITKYKITSSARLSVEINFENETTVLIQWEDDIYMPSKEMLAGSYYRKWIDSAETRHKKSSNDWRFYHK